MASGAPLAAITYSFPLGGVTIAITVGIVFGMLAAWLPARRASKLDVVTALHYE